MEPASLGCARFFEAVREGRSKGAESIAPHRLSYFLALPVPFYIPYSFLFFSLSSFAEGHSSVSLSIVILFQYLVSQVHS